MLICEGTGEKMNNDLNSAKVQMPDFKLFSKQLERSADYILNYTANCSKRPLNTILRYMILSLGYGGLVQQNISYKTAELINTAMFLAIYNATNLCFDPYEPLDISFQLDIFKHLLKGASQRTMDQLGISTKKEILYGELEAIATLTHRPIQIRYVPFRIGKVRSMWTLDKYSVNPYYAINGTRVSTMGCYHQHSSSIYGNYMHTVNNERTHNVDLSDYKLISNITSDYLRKLGNLMGMTVISNINYYQILK